MDEVHTTLQDELINGGRKAILSELEGNDLRNVLVVAVGIEGVPLVAIG